MWDWAPYTVTESQKTVDDVLRSCGFDSRHFTPAMWELLLELVWQRPENQGKLGANKYDVLAGETILVPMRTPRQTPIAPKKDQPNLIKARPVTILIAALQTAAPRSSDEQSLRDHNRVYPNNPWDSVERVRAYRGKEGENFINKTTRLKERMVASKLFDGETIILEKPTTGQEFLDALQRDSKDHPIKNLVFFGHSGPYGFYMKENSAFYRWENDFDGLNRATGARFVKDFDELVKSKAINFADDALVLFCGCKAAGDHSIDRLSLAHFFTTTTGATTIGSIGGSDQFIAPSDKVEKSRLYWAVFTKDNDEGRRLTRQELQSDDDTVLDPLKVLHR